MFQPKTHLMVESLSGIWFYSATEVHPATRRNSQMKQLPVTCLSLLAVLLLAGSASAQPGFQPSCTLPFESIREDHPIDSACKPGGSAAQHAQNRAKNNFCASGNPTRITFDDLVKLQQAAKAKGIPFGGTNLPEDREVLKDLTTNASGTKIGEGKKVRLVAFVINAHYSNISKGESVNCKKKGRENNDIHLVLGRTPNDTPCRTVTAEISPHFRPLPWDTDNLNSLTHPVRFTGQLFFDASHKPCPNPDGPDRASNWEIHPVYAIDVCKNKTMAGCPINNESKWVPLHKFLGFEEDDTGRLDRKDRNRVGATATAQHSRRGAQR